MNPFPKDLFTFEDKFEARYSRDKFLDTASLNITGNIPLKFKRINETKYQADIKKIFNQKIDLGHLNIPEEGTDDLDNLLKSLSYCQSEMQNLNKSILKQMPHESYLMYRRIINLNQFCSRLETILIDNESSSTEKKFYIIAESVKKLFNEDASELPHSVTQFSERTLYYNHAFSFLWPRITKILIQNSVKEIFNLYSLDLNRKSLLGIQLKIASMQQRAVVRADITQINSSVRYSIQTDPIPNMKASSLTQTPINTDVKSSYYLNGLIFANQTNFDLKSICENHEGSIGIDLGDVPQGIVNSGGVRGIWDAQTKLATARLFGIRATSEKTCSNVYFRTEPGFAKFLTTELDTLKNESLSLESSMLLSNYGQKKLWVMPGKYRIVISSIINEKVISIQEFIVGVNTQTNVVANVH